MTSSFLLMDFPLLLINDDIRSLFLRMYAGRNLGFLFLFGLLFLCCRSPRFILFFSCALFRPEFTRFQCVLYFHFIQTNTNCGVGGFVLGFDTESYSYLFDSILGGELNPGTCYMAMTLYCQKFCTSLFL